MGQASQLDWAVVRPITQRRTIGGKLIVDRLGALRANDGSRARP
jgi:hypothetical protein